MPYRLDTPQNIPSESRIPDLSRLSGSVASLVDEEAVDFTSVSARLEIAGPRVRRQDSCARGQSRRDSSDDFEKMIISIVKDKGPLRAPTHSAPVVKESFPISPALEQFDHGTVARSPTESTAAPEGSPQPSSQSVPRTTVMRGFSPSQISTPRTISGAAQSPDAIPEPRSSPAAKVEQTKQPTRFIFGGSCSSSERDQTLRNSRPSSITNEPNLQIGGSSDEEGSLKSAVASSRPGFLLSGRKKQGSSRGNNMTRAVNDGAAVDSDTDDYIDENAIDDDDDSSDWEDSIGESDTSSMDDTFQRVDFKPNLTSRQSLITLMLTQNDRASNLGNHASQSTSAIPRSRLANSPSAGASPDDSDEAPLMKKGSRGPSLQPIDEVPRSGAQPIMAGSQDTQPQAASSPRTTRRNMRETEWTGPLSSHLLWKRQKKSLTVNAILKQDPEKPWINKSHDVSASSWNQYFSKEASDGYHSKGW